MDDNKKALENESVSTFDTSIIQPNSGFVKLHRRLLEWEWYLDLPVRVLFLHCLLKANHKAKKWMGQIIQPGQFATSLKHLSEETALSQQQCRTALSKLKSTGEITSQSTSQYSIITVKNWKLYQAEQQTKQQTSNKRATTTKEIDILLHRISIKENINEEWIKLISDWLQYKRSKNQSYKTEQSLKAFIQKLFRLSNNNIETAKAIIDESMANNWNGIFELKQNQKDNPKGEEYVYNPYL